MSTFIRVTELDHSLIYINADSVRFFKEGAPRVDELDKKRYTTTDIVFGTRIASWSVTEECRITEKNERADKVTVWESTREIMRMIKEAEHGKA